MGAADLSQNLGSVVSSVGASDLFLILAAAMSWPRSGSFSGEPKRVFWVLKQETEQVVPFWSGRRQKPWSSTMTCVSEAWGRGRVARDLHKESQMREAPWPALP